MLAAFIACWESGNETSLIVVTGCSVAVSPIPVQVLSLGMETVTLWVEFFLFLGFVCVAKSSKPWREYATFVQEVLHWKNTAESLVAFLVRLWK